MSLMFPKPDAPLLNLFVKTVNDARLAQKWMAPDEMSEMIFEKFRDQDIHWLPHIETILQDAQIKLFSYGSLQPGEQNEHMLHHISGLWRDGFVHGDVAPTGWGASFGFPVLTPDYTAQKPQVHGKLFTSPGLTDHWDVLDEFEGEDYARLLTVVYFNSPEAITVAYVY